MNANVLGEKKKKQNVVLAAATVVVFVVYANELNPNRKRTHTLPHS